jgi:hypothetical protein
VEGSDRVRVWESQVLMACSKKLTGYTKEKLTKKNKAMSVGNQGCRQKEMHRTSEDRSF